jgi:hypothetical protein
VDKIRQTPAAKQFFFEKKNQKTFVLLVGRGRQDRFVPRREKVFWFFFFKKELLPSRLAFLLCVKRNDFWHEHTFRHNGAEAEERESWRGLMFSPSPAPALTLSC